MLRHALALLALTAIFGSARAAVVAPCGGFVDVPASSPFCAGTEWIANRGITLGCAAGAYCPDDPVTRLSMAAFMQRMGGVLTPVLLQAEDAQVGVGGEGVVCSTAALPARSHPRMATVHTRLTGTVTGSASASTFVVASHDGGATWRPVSTLPGPIGPFRSDVPATLSDTGVLDVAPGASVRFGLRVATATTASVQGACVLVAIVGNRNGSSSPLPLQP